MEPAKIIARYRDGRMIKGLSQDFSPKKPVFHLYREAEGVSGAPVKVDLNELKAVFFAKNFSGDRDYKERKVFVHGDKSSGRKVEVIFADGEMIQGSVLGYNPRHSGFFLFPVDPESNNIRAFVVNGAVKDFRYL
jgi:hypothetical protein